MAAKRHPRDQDVISEFNSYGSRMPECLGRTILHAAATRGHLELLENVVEKSGLESDDRNPEDHAKKTPLHLAAEYGHLSVVKFLVPFLSDKNPKTGPYWSETTPLHDAAYEGHLPVVEYLVENIKGDINPSKNNGPTVLHLAAEGGSLNVVSFFTKRLSNPNPIMKVPTTDTESYCDGRTPLHMAAQLGHFSIVQHICSLITDKNPKDSFDYTPLHLAASSGHIEIVEFLLQFVENKNPKAEGHWRGISPLHNAAIGGHLDIIKLLEEHVEGDINPAMSDGDTAFDAAARKGHLDIVSYLVGDRSRRKPKKLPNPNPGQNSNDELSGKTPLHMAAQLGHLQIVQHICSRLVDKNPKDSNGVTPLHTAAIHGQLEVVKYLVQLVEDKHPKSGDFWHRFRFTPMDFAIAARTMGNCKLFSPFSCSCCIKATQSNKSKQTCQGFYCNARQC